MPALKNPARTHKLRPRWVEDEARMRASYVASRRLLAPFLVPHRFEGKKPEPAKLRRAAYGYGIALNRSYLTEIMGHLRSADVTREWGPLAQGEADKTDPDGTPKGGMARLIHADATGTGVPLDDFMGGEVLEWMLSSTGGFLVVDAPPRPEGVQTKADEQAAGIRPFLRFVPMSAVEDRDASEPPSWVKFKESVDNRDPDGDDRGEDVHHVLYQLLPDGTTEVGRYNKDGALVNKDGTPADAPVNLGAITDPEGRAILSCFSVRHGIHPEVPFIGTGLLYGLDDIVIDLFNVTSEMREAYRDAAFALLTHVGPDGEKVRAQLGEGTRLVLLGDLESSKLERLSGDSAEVATGITLIEMGVRNWALSARRQAAEAMGPTGGAANDSSGVALSAERQLDLKPLLVSISTALDAVETTALFVAAQLAGEKPEGADAIRVTRGTEYRLEDEASRIARIAKEYILSLPLTAEMKVQLAMAWLKSANVIDLTAPVEVPEKVEAPAPTLDAEGNPVPPDPAAEPVTPPEPKMVTMTVGERIEMELRELADAAQSSAVQMASGPGLNPDLPFPPLKVLPGGGGKGGVGNPAGGNGPAGKPDKGADA